jgi:drug/metabolite transporter (DMT)-like permease
MYRKVDPAALLFAIFTVTFSPLTTVGMWDPINTVLAVVVGVVLGAFTWPRKITLKDESDKIPPIDGWIILAQAIAYGTVIATGIAWPVQQIWLEFVPDSLKCKVPEKLLSETCIDIAGYVTWVALGIGLMAAIILAIWIRKRIKKLRPMPPSPPAPPSPASWLPV